MPAPDFTNADWTKANASLESNCVEVAFVDGAVGVRDSKNPEGPMLAFTPAEWDAFLVGAQNNEFVRPTA